MRWRRRRRLRKIQEQEQQRQLMLQQLLPALIAAIEPVLHLQLMQLAAPLAEALQRQDSLLEQRTDAIVERLRVLQEQQTDLMMEVLQSLQPTAEQQLLPELEPSTLRPSRRNSHNSAPASRSA